MIHTFLSPIQRYYVAGKAYLFESFFTQAAMNERSVSVPAVLHHSIRLGCFFALRNLLESAIASTSSRRAPHLRSAVRQMMRDNDCDDLAAFMASRPALRTRERRFAKGTLAPFCSFTRTEVWRLASALASVLPHAAKYHSSTFISEAVTSKGDYVCVDGHFNNLNCLAIAVAHLLTALFSTDNFQNDNEEEDETFRFEKVLSMLAKEMIAYISDNEDIGNGKQHHDLLDSATIVLSLIVEKSPGDLDYGSLKQWFPLPIPLVHRAKYRFGSKIEHSKRFKLLTLDSKSQMEREAFSPNPHLVSVVPLAN